MRVLMAAGIYSLSGASTIIENLTDKLSEKGVDVTIGALKFKRILPKAACSVSTLPIHNVSKLKRFLDNFDIVHSHHPVTNYLALLSNNPFIYHFHGAPNFGRENLYRFSMLSSIKITGHRFDAIIAVSETTRTELKQYFNLDKIHVIYNGVDTNLFKPRLDEGFRKGTPQYLFVGNLYGYKKVEELILALKEVIKTHPKAHLLIVGEGYAYAKLVNLVRRLGLQKHVSFVGFVSHSELPYYYSSCDVYVTASRCESFSLPLLEAWACGTPVVASSIAGHAELLSKSKAGRLYAAGNVEDLCKSMIAVYEQRAMFRKCALSFAKENDWSIVTNKVLRIYNNLVKERRSYGALTSD